MNHRLLLITLASLLVPNLGSASEVTDAGVCAACHGADGNSVNPLWPKLAGQHASYIASQMEAFRDGTRQDPLMSAQAQGLSDEDILAYAQFFAEQPLRVGAAPDDAELVAQGERLYRGGNATRGLPACIACHGPNGRGNPTAGFAGIGGQHGGYVAKALREYAAGTRTTDPESMMRNVASLMTDREIQAVAAYVQGLH
jgi:cytochrome c553